MKKLVIAGRAKAKNLPTVTVKPKRAVPLTWDRDRPHFGGSAPLSRSCGSGNGAEEMTMVTKYQINTRSIPGAQMTTQGRTSALRDARRIASEYRDRRDLTWQDVRIERTDGSLVEYAGPAR